MAKHCKIPTDPEVYQYVIEAMALAVPYRLIGDAIEVNENTVKGWKRRKEIKRDYAKKVIEFLTQPIKTLAKSNPGLLLQTHPETRDVYSPPTQKQEVSGTITFQGWGKPNDDDPA